MLSPSEAEKIILEEIQSLPGEDCPIADAHGRLLRMTVKADRDLPPFDRATLDGFALSAAALAAGRRRFRIEGVQAAGMMARTLAKPAEACVEIMTGAMLPTSADCVVPFEHAVREGTEAVVDTTGAQSPAGHGIHRRGSDAAQGAELLTPGMRLTPQAIAVAAACGVSRLTVSIVPKIAVVATGDELVEVGMAVGDHQIRRSNDYALRAALVAAGYPRVERFHLRDVPDEIEHRVWHLLAEFDALVLCGGVSKGKFDFLPSLLEKLGVVRRLRGVAQRPGKPMWFGMSGRRTPVFALPGNPVAAFVCLHRYVLPALARASGAAEPVTTRVRLSAPVRGLPSLAQLVPVTRVAGSGVEGTVQPRPTNTSGDFVSLIGTDGFVELPPSDTEFPAGTIVPYRPWSG